MLTDSELKQLIALDQYATQVTGIEMQEVTEEHAVCTLKVEEKHLNFRGHTMGGVLFTLADFCFGVLSNARQPGTVTLSSQIQYLSSPKGKFLTAETIPLRQGRRISFYETTITDELGNLVAKVSNTGYYSSKTRMELPKSESV